MLCRERTQVSGCVLVFVFASRTLIARVVGVVMESCALIVSRSCSAVAWSSSSGALFGTLHSHPCLVSALLFGIHCCQVFCLPSFMLPMLAFIHRYYQLYSALLEDIVSVLTRKRSFKLFHGLRDSSSTMVLGICFRLGGVPYHHSRSHPMITIYAVVECKSCLLGHSTTNIETIVSTSII